MRSTNVSPGREVIRTTIRSESTLVPPVTALRSPPDSLTTGADSPVIADSSIAAIPQTMSPSPGTNSPAVTTTMSPKVRSDDGVCTSAARSAAGSAASSYAAMRFAGVLVRVFRRLSACALPRPSATDSARLANSTVSHSQPAMAHVKVAGIAEPPEGSGPPRKGSATAMAVVSAAPTSTMNITGLRHMDRGSSFRNAPGMACARLAAVIAEERRTVLPLPVAGAGACVVAVDMASAVLLRAVPG
ncbi:hypothetical protein ARUL111621_15220 [Arthrobacter ulcerisalmonis]